MTHGVRTWQFLPVPLRLFGVLIQSCGVFGGCVLVKILLSGAWKCRCIPVFRLWEEKRSKTLKLNLHQLLAERPCWIHMICQSQKVLCGLPKDGNSPLSLLSRYSAAWSRVAILIAGIGRTEERRSGVRARPLLTGKACLVAGRAAAQLPQAVTAAAAAGSTGPSAAPSNGGESPAIWCLPKPRNYFSKPKNGFRSWIKTAGDTETDTKRAKQLGQSIWLMIHKCWIKVKLHNLFHRLRFEGSLILKTG